MIDEKNYELEWEQYIEQERYRYESEMQEYAKYEYKMAFDELIHSIEFNESVPRL